MPVHIWWQRWTANQNENISHCPHSDLTWWQSDTRPRVGQAYWKNLVGWRPTVGQTLDINDWNIFHWDTVIQDTSTLGLVMGWHADVAANNQVFHQSGQIFLRDCSHLSELGCRSFLNNLQRSIERWGYRVGGEERRSKLGHHLSLAILTSVKSELEYGVVTDLLRIGARIGSHVPGGQLIAEVLRSCGLDETPSCDWSPQRERG